MNHKDDSKYSKSHTHMHTTNTHTHANVSQVLLSLTHSKLRRFQGYMMWSEKELYVNIGERKR